ncbi:ATP-binding cassette domain-containing protein [Streptomyces scabiei]|nr:ATP-binding cassette domain-containing protein [Streptomyces scabiei]MDW8805149.1 ATP-binding cassette domain-containing protein [Streptomyces scabiei]
MTGTPVLRIDRLAVRYPGRGFRKPPTTVVEDVSFEAGHAETVALVGESGSGKTTIGRAVLGLTPVGGGRVLLDGRDITRLAGRARRLLASDLQAIFQNPCGSLNPRAARGPDAGRTAARRSRSSPPAPWSCSTGGSWRRDRASTSATGRSTSTPAGWWRPPPSPTRSCNASGGSGG